MMHDQQNIKVSVILVVFF